LTNVKQKICIHSFCYKENKE